MASAYKCLPCRHCNDYRRCRAGGLCARCFKDDALRLLYPPVPSAHREPTTEELDRTIAEQMRCLPDWWHNSHGWEHV